MTQDHEEVFNDEGIQHCPQHMDIPELQQFITATAVTAAEMMDQVIRYLDCPELQEEREMSLRGWIVDTIFAMEQIHDAFCPKHGADHQHDD